jgi:uncharacterized protein YdeI (YjbR/CyaY-like superfamily)
MGMDDYEHVEVTSVAELRAWLAAHHDQAQSVWLVTWKKQAAPDKYVDYDDIVRELLCYGWIDAKAMSVDAERTRMIIAPRRAQSGWSRSNKTRVAELSAAGRIEAPGWSVIEAAKASGAWTALDDIENLVVPDDLQAAFDANPTAYQHWQAFPRSAKRSILEWVSTAKRAETRIRRVCETVELAADNIRAHQG